MRPPSSRLALASPCYEWRNSCRFRKMSEGFRTMHNASRSAYPWSQAEDELLGGLIRSRISASSISVILQRTTRAVRRRAEVLKISWKAARAQSTYMRPVRPKRIAPLKWTMKEDQLLAQFIASGYCEKNIATQFARSVNSIRIRASKLKISLKIGNRKAIHAIAFNPPFSSVAHGNLLD